MVFFYSNIITAWCGVEKSMLLNQDEGRCRREEYRFETLPDIDDALVHASHLNILPAAFYRPGTTAGHNKLVYSKNNLHME